MINEFFQNIDRDWQPSGCEPIDLHIIGSTALFLKTDYDRETKDSDILQLSADKSETMSSLKILAGKGTELARKHGLYLDIVPAHVLFLPLQPDYEICTALSKIQNFKIFVLDVHDVVVSKLLPYRTQDREDIIWLADHQLIMPSQLADRFKLAIDNLNPEKTHHATSCIENLHEVQREILRVAETEIILPTWLKYTI